MLAAPTKPSDWPNIRYPTLASPKIDGMRALCRIDPYTGQPQLVSRTLKPIKNKYTQQLFARQEFVGLDGELIVGGATDKNLMQQTTSGVMSEDGEPDVKWAIFDKWNVNDIYARRAHAARLIVAGRQHLEWVPHITIGSFAMLEAQEEAWLQQGYEGMMIRDPHGPYKQNRSTLKEGYLLKIKRFADSEAEVLGYQEQMTNNNELLVDERGYAKRTTHLAGKEGADMLGSLLVRDLVSGVEFDLGTGFTREQRINLWEGRKYLIGKLVTYKHFTVGVVDKPRFPTFKAFRDRSDL
ncbi:MAG: ATP-dependent DNA ligase [Bacteroidota bacterium]